MSEATKPVGTAAWPWPEALDALWAAPRHHRFRFENDRVRALDTRVSPGDRVPVHTHRWPAVNHISSWSDFMRRDAEGCVLVDTRGRPPPASLPLIMWSEALPPHSLENVNSAELQVMSIEIKDAPAPEREARP
jgi:hypothetical protein